MLFSSQKLRNIAELIWDSNHVYTHGFNGEPVNDWIILKLSSPLTINSDVQPACLPESNWAPENDSYLKHRCFTSGYGDTSSGK